MGLNNTRYKSLDRLAKHPAVDEIWVEIRDEGIWLSLKPGWRFYDGCSSTREDTCHGAISFFNRAIMTQADYDSRLSSGSRALCVGDSL